MAKKTAAVFDLKAALDAAAKAEKPISRAERARRALAADPAAIAMLKKKLGEGITAAALAKAMRPHLPGVSAAIIAELTGALAAQTKAPPVTAPAAPQQAATRAPQDDVPNIAWNLGGSESVPPPRPVKK